MTAIEVTPELEAVARALAAYQYGNDKALPDDVHYGLARAALASIREPTEGMAHAGTDADLSPSASADCIRRVIDYITGGER